MCGINGVYTFSGNDQPESVIRKMNKLLEKRGPDAEGIYSDNDILLGHRRLSIIDLNEKSNQPFHSSDGRYTLVFNGEIYNFQSIKNQLSDYNFITDGDTEVVLAAFIKWGPNCLRSFNGMFAFAIWDKEKKELFIARDRLGIKPLYYHLSNERILFSSSVRSILSTDIPKRTIDPESLVDYLRYQTVHAPKTIIKDIFMLMPGHYMVVNEEGSTTKMFWDITSDYKRFSGDQSEAKKLVRDQLEASVERRLVADVPFGAFLSGGIDSSIIVALMSAHSNTRVNTFSVVFKENEYSEGEYAQMVADQYATDHHEIELSIEDFKSLIPDALSAMDHPSGDGPNTYVVSKRTRESGIKMALTGLGGDELFGGYSIFNQIPELQSKKWLSSFPAYGRKPIAGLYHMMKNTVESSKIKEILKLEYFDTEYIHQYYRQVLMDDQISKLLNTSRLPIKRSFTIAHDLIGYQKSGWSLPLLSRISVAEISTYMQNVLLRDADQMSMANSLELRVPFLDHELIEAVLGIPDKFKKPISPKKLLVDACEDLIPKQIYDRPKMGFVLPYATWMKSDLREYCEEQLNELKKISYFHEPQIDRLWHAFLQGKSRVTWSRIWPLVVLGHWVKENHVEG